MDTTQVIEQPTDIGFSQRLNKAYKRVSPNLRALARRDFCQYHGVTDDSFRSKRTGQRGYVATEAECEWMEAYKPQINPA
ncbi:hypothetical protein [Fibrella forsythiae]|uniref:Uncharacterized protein n=1 Tax=Fibrella forsythiae TaxID=2817061 RepID=A0ABS3JTX2_9BACT|nr:hypothetical protein [Fibrella forsythiae]MBO0952903.1 hypothetical protein [Fibrella forsythiae]